MDYLKSTETLKSALKDVSGAGNIEFFKDLDSTNIYLKEKILRGDATPGDIVFAAKQTAGIGRGGRRFFSPEGTGLYFSILLHPKTDTELITAAAGVSVYEAIKEVFEMETEIKWVNDIYLRDRKVCGILAQRCSAAPELVILGCGVNIAPPENGFPKEISGKAGFITDKVNDSDYGNLAVNIIKNILKYTSGKEEYIKKYSSLQYLNGKKVSIVNLNGENRDGKNYTVLSTDEKCRLAVSDEDGNISYLDSGEVSVIPKT